MWAENADENMQRKKQYAQFMMLQIEDDKHVYVIYMFVTLPFRTKVQAPVVQTMDSAIHRINRYPLDK